MIKQCLLRLMIYFTLYSHLSSIFLNVVFESTKKLWNMKHNLLTWAYKTSLISVIIWEDLKNKKKRVKKEYKMMGLGVATFIIIIYVSSHEYNVHDSFFFDVTPFRGWRLRFLCLSTQMKPRLWNKFGLNVKMLNEIYNELYIQLSCITFYNISIFHFEHEQLCHIIW